MRTIYDAVIIGAGLGGLSAGAHLARAGLKVLVLERSGVIGGRCRSVELMDHSFDIGADYFGAKLLKTFGELGKAASVDPVRFRTLAYTEAGTMTMPPGLHTPGELRGMGMTPGDTGRFAFRMGRQLALNNYGRLSNNYQLINAVTENKHLRDVLNIGAFFSGNDPENMPVYWFNLIFGGAYGYNRPFYPRGGSGRIPGLLAEVIRENDGGIVFGVEPRNIIVERGRAVGVDIGDRRIAARAVISGVGIMKTVHGLAGKEHFPYGFLNTLSYYREGLSMASVFTVFGRGARVTKGVHVYARFARNLRAMFRVLGEGRFPDKSMFILSCPDAIVDPGTEHLAGTVKFLVPKGCTDKAAIEAEADKVLAEVDLLVPGFQQSVVERMLFTPEDYEKGFGFRSTVTPVAESVHYEKFPVQTPLPGLYCVGSTVLPVGGGTSSAVESGANCAAIIIKELGTQARAVQQGAAGGGDRPAS